MGPQTMIRTPAQIKGMIEWLDDKIEECNQKIEEPYRHGDASYARYQHTINVARARR